MKKNNIINILIALIIIIIVILIIYSITQNQNRKNYGIRPLTHTEIKTKQLNKEDFILIVSRKNCSHCISYKPKVERIAQDNQIIVYYIDLETVKDEEKFLKEYKLSGSTPMTLFFKKGKETSILNRIEGDLKDELIINKFKEMGFIEK